MGKNSVPSVCVRLPLPHRRVPHRARRHEARRLLHAVDAVVDATPRAAVHAVPVQVDVAVVLLQLLLHAAVPVRVPAAALLDAAVQRHAADAGKRS